MEAFLSPDDWTTVSLTLRVAALATLITLPPGLALGWLLARCRFVGKSAIETLVALPLVMPPVATGLILLHLFGRRGVVGGVLLGFARALGEFGATIVVAGSIPGRTQTIALSIYHAVQLGDDGPAFRLLAVSAVIAFGAVFLSERLLGRTT